MSNKLIDKLLNDRREFGDVWIADEDAKAIAAALKAGQKMRNALQHLKDTEGFYAPNSCAAWDAALEEDV